MESGLIYSIRSPGAVMPQYIGQTVNLVRRKADHISGRTPCTSRFVVNYCAALGVAPVFTVEQEIEANDKTSLRFLLDAGERGFIEAYASYVDNELHGGKSMFGEGNPFFGKRHETKTRQAMRAAWTPERKAKQAAKLKGNTPWAALTDNQVLTIRASEASNRELASVFGVSEHTVLRVRQHKFYTHVGGKPYVSRRYKHGKYAKSLK